MATEPRSLPTGKPAVHFTRYNPPGQTRLVYDAGDYLSVFNRMVHRLPQVTFQSPGDDQERLWPLRTINYWAGRDWSMALLRAWAMLVDILAFYQERIVNEGYLNTATEARSVMELLRSIGYELAPPLAATTHLAFTVAAEADQPQRRILIPPGVAVQSVPPAVSPHEAVQAIIQGNPAPAAQQPVIFETVEPVAARAAWNEMELARFVGNAWPLHHDPAASPVLRLAGIDTGLRPGDAILVVGQSLAEAEVTSLPDPSQPWQVLQVEGVTPSPPAGYTEVTWRKTLGSQQAGHIEQPCFLALRRRATLFPYAAGSLFRLDAPRDPTADSAGDSDKDRWTASSGRWWPTNRGLPATPLRAAVAIGQQALFVATGKQILGSRDGGDTWTVLDYDPLQKEVHALTAGQRGELYAGTEEGGVHTSADGGQSWAALSGPGVVDIPSGLRRFWKSVEPKLPKTTVRSLLSGADRDQPFLLAGTDDGVFRYQPRSKAWQPSNGGLPDVDAKTGSASVTVRALAAAGQKRKPRLYAGTDRGVFPVRPRLALPDLAPIVALLAGLLLLQVPDFGSPPEGTKDLPGQLPDLIAEVFKVLQSLMPLLLSLLSIVAAALVVLKVVAKVLEQIPKLLERLPKPRFDESAAVKVNDMANDGQEIFVATDSGVFRLAPGSAGQRFLRRLAGLLWGARPEPLVPLAPWPTSPTRDTPDQDEGWRVRALAFSAEGDLLAAVPSGELYRWHSDAGAWTDITPGEPMPLAELVTLIPAGGYLYAGGEPWEKTVEWRWSPYQVGRGQIDLDKAYPALTPGSWLVLQPLPGGALNGQQPESCLLRIETAVVTDSRDLQAPGPFSRVVPVGWDTPVGEGFSLASFDRTACQVLAHSQQLVLHDDLFEARQLQGQTITLAGQVLDLRPGQKLIVTGQVPSGQYEAELVTIAAEPRYDAGGTTITLDTALAHTYLHQSVKVHGNVAYATQGQTIVGEALGTSDGTVAYPRFTLRSPLTHLASGEPGGYDNTLQVRVNGVPWHKVPSLIGQKPDARAYMLRRDAQGRTAVMFGDGEHGARLPSGQERVTASYRSGGGPEGNVDARSLTLLQSRPAGVQAVTNPLPASGGTAIESADHARQQAAHRLRSLRRIVSLTDFEDFALAYPGIGKARVRLEEVWLPGRRRDKQLVLIIAGEDGTSLRRDSDYVAAFRRAVENARSMPNPLLRLRFAQPRTFAVRATLLVDTGQRTKDEIERAARQALARAFSFAARELGQDVATAEVIAALQNVSGVVAVPQAELVYADEPLDQTSKIAATPGQVLYLDPEAVNLTLEVLP